MSQTSAALPANAADFYRQQHVFTDPGEYAPLFDALPAEADVAALCTIINGVVIHNWKVRKFHPHRLAAPDAPHSVGTRHTRALLAAIVAARAEPLTMARSEDERTIVDCRQFATLLTAMLRHRDVPARARCGFATYLEDTHYQDHWVCEWWNADAGRWTLTDPDLQMPDVARDEFFTGLRAWELGRDDADFANRCGYATDLLGLYIIRNDALGDFAALCGWEKVSGDAWGGMRYEGAGKTVTDHERAVLNHMTELASDDAHLAERLELYAREPLVTVPPTIGHYDYIHDRHHAQVRWADAP